MSDDRYAPEGMRWVCFACGKHAKDQYTSERGWDESCVLNSALVAESRLVFSESGRTVIEVKAE